MDLLLRRIYLGMDYTIGRLFINNTYFCDTLEDTNRDLNKNGKFDNGEVKIQNETCIPFGTYKVILSYSPRFKKILPEILNVPNFTGIRIHAGNTSLESSGCILVGRNTQKGKVTESKKYMNLLMKSLQDAVNKGEKILLTIT